MMSKQFRILISVLLVCLLGVCSAKGAYAVEPLASQQASSATQQSTCPHPANACYHDQGTYYSLYDDAKHKKTVYDFLYCDACSTYLNYEEDVSYENHVPDAYGNCTLCPYKPESYPDVRISLEADTSSPQVGDTVVVVATITGGSGDFQCGWEAYCDDEFQDGLAFADATLDVRTYHLKITREGRWELICGVIDEKTEKQVNKSKFFTVGTTEPEPSEPDECSHSNLSYIDRKTSYRLIDDDCHEETITTTWKCDDCGETIRRTSKEETHHGYDDDTGICPCGHACPHNGIWSQSLKEAIRYEACNDTSHLVVGMYQKQCWECGAHFGDLYEAHEYEEHAYNSKNVCRQCGHTKSACAHTSCHEVYYLDYDIVDESYHQATWGTVVKVCDDCGNAFEVGEGEYLTVYEAHELTTIDGKQLCEKCGYSPENNAPSNTWWVDGYYYRSDAECGYYCSFWVNTDQDMNEDDDIGDYVEQISLSVTYQGKAFDDYYLDEWDGHYRLYFIQDPIGGFKDDVIVTCTFRVEGRDYSRTLVLKPSGHDSTSGLQIHLSVTPTTDAGLAANAPFRVQADVSKGSGSYQHVFTIQNESEEWTFRTGAVNTCVFTPPEDGLYVIRVRVTDTVNDKLSGTKETTATIGGEVEVQPPALLEAGLYSATTGAFNRGARYGFCANYTFWVFATGNTHEVYARLNGKALNDGQALPLGGSKEDHLYYLAKANVKEGENTVTFTAHGAANPVKTTFYGITKVTEHTQYIIRDQAELLSMPQTGARSGVRLALNTPVQVRGKIKVSSTQNFWYVQVNGKNFFLPVSDLGEQAAAPLLTAEIHSETDSIMLNSTVTLTAAVDGGSGAYRYSWAANCGDQEIPDAGQGATLSLKPTAIGPWTVTLTVTDDSSHQVAQAVRVVQVTEAPAVSMKISITLESDEGVLPNAEMNALVEVTGGSGKYSVVYEILCNSKQVERLTGDSWIKRVRYTANESGYYSLIVTATDKNSGETIKEVATYDASIPPHISYHRVVYKHVSPELAGEEGLFTFKHVYVKSNRNATAVVGCNWCEASWEIDIPGDSILPVVNPKGDFTLNPTFVDNMLDGNGVLHVEHDLYITDYCDLSKVRLDVDGDIIVDVNSKETLQLNVINADNLIVRGKSKVEYVDKGTINEGDTNLKVYGDAQVTLKGHVEFWDIVLEDDATLIVDENLWAVDAEFDYGATFSVKNGTAYFTNLEWRCLSEQWAHVVISKKLHVESSSMRITKLELPNNRELEDCLDCGSLERLHGIYHQGVDVGALARLLQTLTNRSNQRMQEAAILQKESEYRDALREAADKFNIEGQGSVYVDGQSINLDDTSIREDIAAVMMMIADENSGTGFFTDTITATFHKKLTINMGTFGTTLAGSFTYKGRTYTYSCTLDGMGVAAGGTTVYLGSTNVLINGRDRGAVYVITSNEKTVAKALNELIETSKDMVHYELERAVEFVNQEIETICGITFKTEMVIVKELIAMYFNEGIIKLNKNEFTIDWNKFKECREKLKEAVEDDEESLDAFLRSQ